MTERPLSRQMACGHCGHEHEFLECEWCLCPGHLPTGVYPPAEVPSA